jgi:hypothetical protein
MKLVHDSTHITEALYIKHYQNLSKDSKDIPKSSFRPFM